MPSAKSNGIAYGVSAESVRAVSSFSAVARGRAVEERKLVDYARQLLKARRKIEALTPKGLFRDSAWDMMLELFISAEEGGIVFVKQMMIASGESAAAAMRLIDRLDDAEFLKRVPDSLDQRRVIVRLTERGRTAMLAMLKHIYDPAPTETAFPLAFKRHR